MSKIRTSEIFWTGTLPETCDACLTEIQTTFIDGRLRTAGSWGCFHPGCFRTHGGSLGAGRGQSYEEQSDGRFKKING